MMSAADFLSQVKDRRKRRKVVYLGEDWIRRATRMPEDVSIERIDYDVMRQSFIIICSHPDWPEVPDYAEPPSVVGHMTPVWVDGKHFGIEDADRKVVMMDLTFDWEGKNDVHHQ